MISSHVHSTRLCHLSVENSCVRYHITFQESRHKLLIHEIVKQHFNLRFSELLF